MSMYVCLGVGDKRKANQFYMHPTNYEDAGQKFAVLETVYL